MRKFRIIICISVFLTCAVKASSNSSLAELYKELNTALSKREYYINLQQTKIDEYKTQLKDANTLQEQYELSSILANEYAYFKLDSATFYSAKTIDMASELKNENAYYDALIQRAYILCWQGYFHEPIEILESINVEALIPKLQSDYYRTYMMVYYFRQLRVMNLEYRLLYRAESLKYTELYLASEPVTADKSPSYLSVLAYKYYQLRDYQSAVNYMTEAIRKNSNSPISNVDMLYLMYLSYTAMGEEFEEEAESCLLQSANPSFGNTAG